MPMTRPNHRLPWSCTLKMDNRTFQTKGLMDMEKFRKNVLNLHVGYWVLLLMIFGFTFHGPGY
jgi:hypothetical protein